MKNKKVVGENLIKGSGDEYYKSVKDMTSTTIYDTFIEKIRRVRALAIAMSGINFNVVDPDRFVCNIALDMENETDNIEALIEELFERVKDETEANVA